MKSETKKRSVAALVLIFFICAVILAVLLLAVFRLNGFRTFYSDEVQAACDEYGVDRWLIYGMIYAESGGRSDAVSRAGAVGAMQLMPSTAEWIAKKTGRGYSKDMLTDPEYNITLGCAYVAYLQGIFSDDECVIAAYNAGPRVVKEWLADKQYSSDGETLDSIPYEETRGHVKKVKNAAEIYRRLYEKE